jgi:hypothetical protein
MYRYIFTFDSAHQAFLFANLLDSDEYDLVDPMVTVFAPNTNRLYLSMHVADAIRENVRG